MSNFKVPADTFSDLVNQLAASNELLKLVRNSFEDEGMDVKNFNKYIRKNTKLIKSITDNYAI